MDRSFQSSIFGVKSPFSPRSRQNITGRQSMGAGFKKSSRISISGKSGQSVQYVLKSQWNTVERFGQPLPVLITEALTFAERNTIVSARISSECGYAWLVCGRRLLIWQYRQSPVPVQFGTPRRAAISNQCFELQLPQSDLAHRAELVSVFVNNNGNVPSCIAVSPEGVVRYWPAIAHEEISIEQSVDLQGQECDSLTGVEGLGCILATTTCTIVLVQPHLSSGRHSLTCRMLKMPSGWLGGLSKKMSSLIFGPISNEQSAETRLVRVLSYPISDHQWVVYVIAGHSLQKWQLSSSEPENLVYVADLSRLVREGFYLSVWENCGADHSDTDVWILDLQMDGDNVSLLAAAVNMHHSQHMHYALISIDTSSNQVPTQLSNFYLLKMSGLYRENNQTEVLGYRFMLTGNVAYVYNHRAIIVVKQMEEPDALEFNSPQDFLLGGSICVNTPVFFSRNHGLVSVIGNDLAGDLSVSVMSSGTPAETTFTEVGVENLTLYTFNPVEMQTAYKDTVGQIKAAFIFYVKNQLNECNDILNTLFFSDGYIPGLDTGLDKSIVSISKDLLDDIPANDPRWVEENQVGIGSSYSMQVLKQLEDKQKAHTIFVRFLKETELWQKLSAVTFRGSPMATAYILAEDSEKIVAAISLKNLPYNKIMQNAVESATKNEVINYENGLTNQDVFYRRITGVHKLINELVNNCEETAHSDQNPVEVARIISETNEILLSVLKNVMQYRQQCTSYFQPSNEAISEARDYLPWTSAAGSEGIMNSLITQQHITYNYGIKDFADYAQRSILYEQMVALIDYILDGRKSHIESISGTSQEKILLKQYQTDRRKLIDPLIQDGQWEGAASLAEKYLDFESLVLICEKTDNQARLDEYMDRFHSEDFSAFVYNWYLQQNKQGKLIDRCRKIGTSSRNNKQLQNFLSQHPSLSWIQNAFDRKFDEAANTLRKLAECETESVMRQKTVLSMAKLAKLAAGKKVNNDVSIENINARLELISYQEDVPDYVLQQFGYDTVNPRVISPKDLIHLYICPEYRDATEVEFKKALDLLGFIGDEELRNELTLEIWKTSILRDRWDERDLDSPLEILQHKLMFKIIDLAIAMGADPHDLLPPLDVLTEDPGLAEMQSNKSFQYLIKTGYERVNKIMQM